MRFLKAAALVVAIAGAAAAYYRTSPHDHAFAWPGDAHAAAAQELPSTAKVAVGFSPGNAETLVMRGIDDAQHTIEVAAYSFTSRPIANALLQAKARGVGVWIVADKSQRSARYTSVRFLAGKGIPVRFDDRYSIMHNKFMVIDGNTVETGSFNYTRAAQIRNAENVIVLTHVPSVAAVYAKEWSRLWAESVPYAVASPLR